MFFYFPGLGNILWATGAGSNSCKYFSRGCGLLALPQAQVHLQARVVLFAVWLYLDVDMWPAQPSLSVIRLATRFSSAGRGKTMIVFESVRKRNPAPLNFFLFEIVFQSNASFKKKKKRLFSVWIFPVGNYPDIHKTGSVVPTLSKSCLQLLHFCKTFQRSSLPSSGWTVANQTCIALSLPAAVTLQTQLSQQLLG